MQFSDEGAPDLSHLQATMQAIEQACSSIQVNMNRAAAEATILALSQSPRPYPSCQFILENSQLANARFQAVAAIRDAAIREWGFLTPDDKKNLITFCLCYIMKHANSAAPYVLAKVSAVGAQLMKRGWPDFSVAEREAFFTELGIVLDPFLQFSETSACHAAIVITGKNFQPARLLGNILAWMQHCSHIYVYFSCFEFMARPLKN